MNRFPADSITSGLTNPITVSSQRQAGLVLSKILRNPTTPRSRKKKTNLENSRDPPAWRASSRNNDF